MKLKPFQALYPNFDFIASPDTFCEDAKNSFQEFQKNGFFEKAPQDALFIYQIISDGRSHTGLVALNDVQDFFNHKILKHEKTLSEKEQHQMQLFLKWNAILKPVLLTYPPVAEISVWIAKFIHTHKPMIVTHFERDDQTHKVWAITEGRSISEMLHLFETHVEKTYIADGHHRTTTVALLHERLKGKNKEFDFDNLFCAYFAADQLDILDYNRIVQGLKEVSPTRFIVGLTAIFDLKILEKPRKPKRKHEIVMFAQKEWYSLVWKKEVLSKQPRGHVILDASLLNKYVLQDIFGIKDVRTDTRITYVDGAKGLDGVKKAASETDSRVGFMLFPVSIEDLVTMADIGESLPPKSTYFEPRLKSGMIVKMLKE